jgi:hypothetical protein
MKKPCFPEQVSESDFEKVVGPNEAKAMWDYAKQQSYFNHDYEALINGLHDDIVRLTGQDIPRTWIVKTLASNKTVRNATAQMKIANMERQNILARAKIEAEYIDQPRAVQFFLLLNDLYRAWYTLYHGPVFPWTHAASLAEMAVRDIATIPYQVLVKGVSMNELAGRNFYFARMVNQTWKNFMSPALYVDMVNRVEAHPRYTFWADAGLDNKMGRAPVGILGGNKITMSMRAWEGMKEVRMMMADAEMYDGDPRNPATMTLKKKYQGISEAELKRVAIEHARTINHATGTLSPKEMSLPGGGIWFAPALTPSKWLPYVQGLPRVLANITKAVEKPKGTAIPRINWKNVTPADRAQIGSTMRLMGGLFGSHAVLLALNEGLLRLQHQIGGPEQHVNWHDGDKSDFLSFKGWGRVFKPRGLIEPIQIAARVGSIFTGGEERYIHKGRQPKSFGEQTSRYFEYKLSPGASLGYEMVRGQDIFGRPLPWGRAMFGTGKEVRESPFAPRYTYPEYILSHGPIWWNEATREFYAGIRDQGINASDAMAIMRGIMSHPKIVRDAAIQGLAGYTGIGMHRDYEAERGQ